MQNTLDTIQSEVDDLESSGAELSDNVKSELQSAVDEFKSRALGHRRLRQHRGGGRVVADSADRPPGGMGRGPRRAHLFSHDDGRLTEYARPSMSRVITVLMDLPSKTPPSATPSTRSITRSPPFPPM